jgi:putative flippase GtrA
MNNKKEIILYLIFGVLTTVVSLATYYLCTITFLNPNNAIEIQIANIISWITCVTFAFFTNRKYVFESKEEIKKEGIKFYISRLSALLIDVVMIFIFVSLLKINDKIIKLVNQVIIIIFNYIASKLFVFKKGK